jgi:catechol 2,3-dioxygenase-like lactoylglutathione lyase family enzyme
MSVRLLAVAFEADDPARTARFWADVLGRDVVDSPAGPLLPGDERQVGLRFARRDGEKNGPNRMHLHLTSASLEDQRDTVARALGLGARHLDVGQRPEEEHVVLADPAGNEFCVIEPGSSFLDGCGVLGEVACDGAREVGLFWSEALGWPLVWDQDDETAIQSPHGGTKVAWGGESETLSTSTWQRFELVAADGEVEREADRLHQLGACRRTTENGDPSITIVDPGGNMFRLIG